MNLEFNIGEVLFALDEQVDLRNDLLCRVFFPKCIDGYKEIGSFQIIFRKNLDVFLNLVLIHWLMKPNRPIYIEIFQLLHNTVRKFNLEVKFLLQSQSVCGSIVCRSEVPNESREWNIFQSAYIVILKLEATAFHMFEYYIQFIYWIVKLWKLLLEIFPYCFVTVFWGWLF